MFNNQIIAGSSGQGGSFYGYSIDQSLRFDGSSAYLNFTPSSSTTATVTISFWVKRSTLGATQYLFASGAANARGNIGFNSSDQLFFQGFNSSGANSVLTSSMLFRDVSSWYHIVVECDGVTTTSNFPTNTNVYVNGSTISMTHSTASSPSGGFRINDTQVKHIGALTPTASSYLSGYMAEVHWIDGTALDATSFGETINGVWVPKEYTGSHGSAGYYLPFDDSSAIGDDESGNTNDWTANNLAASDVVPDSPSGNNFATLNPLFPGNSGAYAEGNLKFLGGGFTSSKWGAKSTFAIPKDKKVYIELEETVTGGVNYAVGVGTDSSTPTSTNVGGTGSITLYHTNFYINGTETNHGQGTSSAGDIIGIAVDGSTGEVWFSRNGTYFTTGGAGADPSTGTDPIGTITNSNNEDLFLVIAANTSTDNLFVNFGQDSTNVASAESDANGLGTFEYAPPTDYVCLAASSLSEPTIGPNSAEQADDYFSTLLWSGDGNDGRTITGVGFQPDWVWVKDRNTARSHVIQDSVRGFNDGDKVLRSNGTNSESSTDNDVYGFVGNTNSDGYTLEDGTTDGRYVNNSGETYVSWNWKAGGSASSNSDGSITSSVSAAPDAGFSIVSWTGNATNPSTIGHGLSSAPEMIILKNRDSAGDWYIGHDDIGWTDRLKFTTAVTASSITLWNNTAPTSSVFTISSALNFNGDATIAYCFHSSDICKVGSYVGNANADGTFVYTGFRPAFVILKASTVALNWLMYDNARNEYNVIDNTLYPNLSNAEATGVASIDFLSNGFKIRNSGNYINQSGQTFIYLAFAEQPFKFVNAR
jgi:hypothetical protein